MKNFAIRVVVFTTLYVFTVVGLMSINMDLNIMISLCSLGCLLILFMVYAVLHDHYQTNKTFDDWYNDHPRKTLL